MKLPDAFYIDSLADENRNLRDAISALQAWVNHWRADVATGLMPTRESLETASTICRKALRKEVVS